MAGVSALLRGAASRQRTVQEQQDALVAFQYDQSTKTYSDFIDYSNYLKDRQKTSDPSKALSYAKSINSAQTAYVSNEVQRQSISTMEGNGDNSTKQQKLIDLYYQVSDSGNYDLAQSLRSQIDSLSITIQNENETRAAAGQALASKMATLRANSVDDAVATLQGYVSDLGDLFKTAGPEKFAEQIKTYAKELGLNENSGFFDVLTNLANTAISIYDNAMASETDPGNIRTFAKARQSLATGNSFTLPGANGKEIKVSIQDLKDQADANRVGEELFKPMQTADGTVFDKNTKTGFVFGLDETGQYRQIPLYGNAPDYTSNVYKQEAIKQNGKIVGYNILGGPEGKTVVATKDLTGKVTAVGSPEDEIKTFDYMQLLENNGIRARKDNGYIVIDNADGKLPGFPVGASVQAYVGPDGNLQVAKGSGIDDVYNVSFDQSGKFTGVDRYNPSAIAQFNGGLVDANGKLAGSARFNQPFYQGQDLNKYGDLSSLVGVVNEPQASRYASIAATFSNPGTVGSLNLPKTPSSVLQPVASPQLAASPLPKVASPQISISPQTAISPMGLPAQPKLEVAAPTPTPTVSVAQPTPTPKVSVAAPLPTPKVTVR